MYRNQSVGYNHVCGFMFARKLKSFQMYEYYESHVFPEGTCHYIIFNYFMASMLLFPNAYIQSKIGRDKSRTGSTRIADLNKNSTIVHFLVLE